MTDVQIDGVASMSVTSPFGEITETSWTPNHSITYEQWYEVGQTLQTIKGSINWWIGDWLQFGERVYGETYAQAIEITGAEYQWLADCKWVSGRVPADVRFPELSWSHHRAVSKIENPDDQLHILNVAVDKKLNVKQTTELVKEFLSPQLPPPSNKIETTPGERDDILPSLGSADMSGSFPDDDDDEDWSLQAAEAQPIPAYLQRQAEEGMYTEFDAWWKEKQEQYVLDLESCRLAWIAAWNISAQAQEDKLSARAEN